MSMINRDNYEAYFLDFAEGNLSPAALEALEDFLVANPDLREELENFENISLPLPEEETADIWEDLKMPSPKVLHANQGEREKLYFRYLEGTFDNHDANMLSELMADETFKAEFETWQKLKLHASAETLHSKDQLYAFGLDKPIADFNYAYYLIARTEGLLNQAQNNALENFAATKQSGKRDLDLADKMRLAPAKGIFYPDKDKLRKKERAPGVIWFYRVGSVAAAILLGFVLWTTVDQGNRTQVQIADETKVLPVDTTTTENLPADKAGKSEEANDSLTSPKHEKVSSPPLEIWEIREPDPVEYAESTKPENQKKTHPEVDHAKKVDDIQRIDSDPILIETEFPDFENMVDSESPTLAENTTEIPNTTSEKNQGNRRSGSGVYETLPDLAERKLLEKLRLEEMERDAMALALAKRFTDKASQLVDGEVNKETQTTDAGESLTYTLRLGSFKVSHTKTK